MSTILRILVLIPLGYIAACLTAGAVLMLAIYRFGESTYSVDWLAIVFACIAAAYAGAFAVLPMLVFVTLAEAFRWRSLIAWTLFGGALGFFAQSVAERAETAFASGGPLRFVAAGVAAGAVYWLVAGRGSGVGLPTSRNRA